MIFAIDLDLPKRIFACHRVRNVMMRKSASRLGFHIRWQCKRSCIKCRKLEKRFDDERRQRYDKRRIPAARRVLWTHKENKKPTAWKKIDIKFKTKSGKTVSFRAIQTRKT